MVPRFDPQRLLVLGAVARAGSIAEAARQLGYTEATLAHHLRVLRAQAGVDLTVRVGRRTRLTPAGAALAGRADAIAHELAGAESDIAAHSDLTAGALRIAAFPSYCAGRLPPVLAEFATRYPRIALGLDEAEPAQAIAALAARKADIAIVFGDPRFPRQLDRYSSHPLFDDEIKLVVPIGHRLAKRRAASLSDLRDETWIAGCPSCRQHLMRLAGDAAFTPRIAFATDDYVAVRRFVAHDLGVALLPRLALDNSPDDPQIAIVELDPPQHRTVTAITDTTPPPTARALLELLDAPPRRTD